MTGEQLKELRKSKKLTQQQLADKARIKSYMSISDYEKSKVKITEPMALLFEILLA
jgi:transcriptional regulator with XRE-family HTH domain